ncbi:outer membrane protein [Polycladidibacter hongkongensis]|uniref:outer membrane protein n=1 Tax=Polycladidibacter hongkongensis TaxID=1647556 RepID=UPI0008314C56|nr:outer membrane beta-barrel protein [Pseudovibrio hongkongensis]
MSLLSRSLGFLVLLAAFPAAAEDLPEPQIQHDPILPMMAEPGGWYLRLDAAYPAANGVDGGAAFQNNQLDRNAVVGAGVGYRFDEMLRVDLSADYLLARRAQGTLAAAPTQESARISGLTFLANAYVDLPNSSALTPYFGAGIGSSYLITGDVAATAADGSVARHGGARKWSLAWAMMAGVGLEISPQLSLDAGYRYIKYGAAHSAAYYSGGNMVRTQFDGLDAHEIRFGMRYQFDSGVMRAPGAVLPDF